MNNLDAKTQQGMTVKQLQHILNGMPDEMVVVVEGNRLIDPHIIVDVLEPEYNSNSDGTEAVCNTVLLSIGSKWEYTENRENDEGSNTCSSTENKKK